MIPARRILPNLVEELIIIIFFEEVKIMDWQIYQAIKGKVKASQELFKLSLQLEHKAVKIGIYLFSTVPLVGGCLNKDAAYDETINNAPAGASSQAEGNDNFMPDYSANYESTIFAQGPFGRLRGLVIDDQRNLIVADYDQAKLWKVSYAGDITSIFDEPAYGDYHSSAAPDLKYPLGLSIMSSGSIYIADALGGKVKKLTELGLLSTIAGGSYDQQNNEACRNQITHHLGYITAISQVHNQRLTLALSNSLNSHLAIIDPAKQTINACFDSYKVTLNGLLGDTQSSDLFIATGNLISDEEQRLAPKPSYGLSFIHKTLLNPVNLELRPNSIYRLNLDTNEHQLIAGAQPAASQTELKSHFNQPHGLALDANGNLLVADAGNNAIRQVSPEGEVGTILQGVFDLADGHSTMLDFPSSIGLDNHGSIFITDENNLRIIKITKLN